MKKPRKPKPCIYLGKKVAMIIPGGWVRMNIDIGHAIGKKGVKVFERFSRQAKEWYAYLEARKKSK